MDAWITYFLIPYPEIYREQIDRSRIALQFAMGRLQLQGYVKFKITAGACENYSRGLFYGLFAISMVMFSAHRLLCNVIVEECEVFA